MRILGLILLVVGLALILSGRVTARSLPPNYEAEEADGFLELLMSVGKALMVIGILFLFAGGLLLLLSCFE